jgi:mRNA interferase RelE/StbE
VETLKGEEGLLRLRVGDYRIIYRVAERDLLVLVLKIGHRRDVYRRPRAISAVPSDDPIDGPPPGS